MLSSRLLSIIPFHRVLSVQKSNHKLHAVYAEFVMRNIFPASNTDSIPIIPRKLQNTRPSLLLPFLRLRGLLLLQQIDQSLRY